MSIYAKNNNEWYNDVTVRSFVKEKAEEKIKRNRKQ